MPTPVYRYPGGSPGVLGRGGTVLCTYMDGVGVSRGRRVWGRGRDPAGATDHPRFRFHLTFATMRAGTANSRPHSPPDGAHRATHRVRISRLPSATQPHAADEEHVASPRAGLDGARPIGDSWQMQPNGIRSSTLEWGSQASGWGPGSTLP